jgi:hypothetical protein
MAFLRSGSTVISFAEYQDVLDRDQRLFEANEGLTEDVVETILIRSTERILSLFRSTDWWVDYYVTRSTTTTYRTVADVPPLNPNYILSRQNDFTDLCVYYALYDYILPKIANFGTEDNAERAKIGYYQQKYNTLFGELITAGDWYDFSGSGTVTSDEKQPGVYNLRRVR